MSCVDYHFNYTDYIEYHGGTMLERKRKVFGKEIFRDWICFDTIEEASAYFNECCSVVNELIAF